MRTARRAFSGAENAIFINVLPASWTACCLSRCSSLEAASPGLAQPVQPDPQDGSLQPLPSWMQGNPCSTLLCLQLVSALVNLTEDWKFSPYLSQIWTTLPSLTQQTLTLHSSLKHPFVHKAVLEIPRKKSRCSFNVLAMFPCPHARLPELWEPRATVCLGIAAIWLSADHRAKPVWLQQGP